MAIIIAESEDHLADVVGETLRGYSGHVMAVLVAAGADEGLLTQQVAHLCKTLAGEVRPLLHEYATGVQLMALCTIAEAHVRKTASQIRDEVLRPQIVTTAPGSQYEN